MHRSPKEHDESISMKNLLKKLTIASCLLVLAVPLYADSAKVINLKDGTVLKGQVLEFKEGVYTLETSVAGQLQVSDEDILSILSAEAGAADPSDPASSNGPGLPQDNTQIKEQVQQLQGSVMSDPALMTDIQGMLNNEELQAIFSDPQFVNDVLSYDPQKINQNEKTQELLQNPQMQAIMEKIQQKMPPQK